MVDRGNFTIVKFRMGFVANPRILDISILLPLRPCNTIARRLLSNHLVCLGGGGLNRQQAKDRGHILDFYVIATFKLFDWSPKTPDTCSSTRSKKRK